MFFTTTTTTTPEIFGAKNFSYGWKFCPRKFLPQATFRWPEKKIFTSVATIFGSLVFLGWATQLNSTHTREMAAAENALPGWSPGFDRKWRLGHTTYIHKGTTTTYSAASLDGGGVARLHSCQYAPVDIHTNNLLQRMYVIPFIPHITTQIK